MNADSSDNKSRPPLLAFAGLMMVAAFSLAAKLGPSMEQRLAENGAADEGPIARWLGDTRRLFAASFYTKADAYFHSGYYPTIFDNNAPFKTAHMSEDSGAAESKNTGDENQIFSHPNNWVERFQNNFFPSRHTHLDEGGAAGELGGSTQVKEIMPWLKLSTALDQSRVETYLVSAYWLRVRMHKVDDAESFLREGLRANPGSAAILFELGEVYHEGRNQPEHARNLYLAALQRWGMENKNKDEKDKFLISRIVAALVKLEREQGDSAETLKYLRLLKRFSPAPEAVQKQIDDIQPANSPSATITEHRLNSNQSIKE